MGDDVARFIFDGVGTVPVSPAVDHGLMTTRQGKAFVRHSVRRCSVADWDIDPPALPLGSPGWQVGAYHVPDSLRKRCPSPQLLVATNEQGDMAVLFPCEGDVSKQLLV